MLLFLYQDCCCHVGLPSPLWLPLYRRTLPTTGGARLLPKVQKPCFITPSSFVNPCTCLIFKLILSLSFGLSFSLSFQLSFKRVWIGCNQQPSYITVSRVNADASVMQTYEASRLN